MVFTAQDGTETRIAKLRVTDTELLLQNIRDASLIHGHIRTSQDTAEAH